MSFKFSATGPDAASGTSPGQAVFSGDGFEVAVASEMIPGTLEWQKKDKLISLILHMGGAISEIESEFDGRSIKLDPPMAGEIWLVPAGVEYKTQVKGASASYIEVLIDPISIAQHRGGPLVKLTPAAGEFDRLLVAKMTELSALNIKQDEIHNIRRTELISEIIERIAEKFSRDPEPKTIREIHFLMK